MSNASEALAAAKTAADRIVKAKRLNACLTPVKDLRKALVAQAQAAHPSGVLYGRILERARFEIQKNYRRPWLASRSMFGVAISARP